MNDWPYALMICLVIVVVAFTGITGVSRYFEHVERMAGCEVGE